MLGLFFIKFVGYMLMAYTICPALRLYWLIVPRRRPANEKLVRFCDVTILMGLTMLLGNQLGGLAFFLALGILGLIVLCEKKHLRREEGWKPDVAPQSYG